MPVQQHEFLQAKSTWPDLEIVSTNRWGEILAVRGSMEGILGGTNFTIAKRKIRYGFYVNVSNIRSSMIPDFWILSPPANSILHVNIFAPNYCPDLNSYLPSLCWGENKLRWKNLEIPKRTLFALLIMAKDVLNNQNFESRTR
ncbi:MAG: hypothetical protein N3B16_00505 [Candidatus Aminicenantes bacterium]|nr:hypothetical protein [Candidatus Aminicenantes bacterium]